MAKDLVAAAHIAALRWVIANYVPPRLQQPARDDAMAVALGVLGGCCGPNGDFSRTEVIFLEQSLHQPVIQIARLRDADAFSLEILQPLDVFMSQEHIWQSHEG